MIFDDDELGFELGSDWYQCPFNKDPEVCTCSTCFLHKEMKRGKAQLKTAWDRNFGRNGTVFGVMKTPEPPPKEQESPKEKYERQKKARYQETENSWSQIQKKVEVPKFDLDEVLANPELDAIKPVNIDPASMLADDIESLTKEGKEFVNNPTWAGLASMAVIAIPGKVAEFGSSVTKDYKQTFFKQYPDLEGKVIVHHAVEQQVQRRYPGLVSDSELHSLENLRGIPKEKNNDLHLSKIRKEWNRFYKTNPNPSKEDLLKKATEIDLKLGGEFKPPIGD